MVVRGRERGAFIRRKWSSEVGNVEHLSEESGRQRERTWNIYQEKVVVRGRERGTFIRRKWSSEG